jgi:hypothetical protein
MIDLTIDASAGRSALAFNPTALVIAGWTGRDRVALEAHIEELAHLGVARPNVVPMFYRASTALLTTSARVEMVGDEASGEVEALLWKQAGRLLVGVGSDHTDRALETIGVTVSKQLCAKPVSPVVWPWEEVAGHWDQVMLRSDLPRAGEAYQSGPVSGLRRPDELLALYEERHGAAADGLVMFCGTLPAIGGIRFAPEMELELSDPVLGRSLRHRYNVDVLPIAEQ